MTLFQLYKVSSYFQWAGSLLIALGCLLNYSVRPNYIKALGYYSIASILFSLAQEYARQSSSSELISTLGNGFVLSEALLLGLLYYFALQHTSFKRAMLVLSSLYIFFYIIVFFLYASHSFSYIRFGRDLLMVVFFHCLFLLFNSYNS
jgi:hypothetical protein